MADLSIGGRLGPLNLEGFPQIILRIYNCSVKKGYYINILAERILSFKNVTNLNNIYLLII